ncbi:MAG: YitT family protein [Negativicutes bacterium]|nr:YitT family protein [Negativicutes bacterium]
MLDSMQSSWRGQIIRHLIIAIGSVICGVSINAFLVPHHMLSGGLSGVAMILHFIWGWPIGAMVALFNLPLMYAAYRLMDKGYFFSAMYGMLIFSVAIDATRGLADLNVVDDIMLAAIYGGVISGIGSGLVFRVNASSGGTDTIAALLKKYYAFNVSFVGFAINCVLMTIAAFLFGFKPAMYTLLSMYVGANVIDRVIQGFNTKKTVTIISDNAEEIAEAIMHEVGRGVTFLHGEGGFTRDDKRVLFVVVTLIQMAKIKPIVNAVDPCAFMIVQDAVEVLGHGFTLPHTKKDPADG